MILGCVFIVDFIYTRERRTCSASSSSGAERFTISCCARDLFIGSARGEMRFCAKRVARARAREISYKRRF